MSDDQQPRRVPALITYLEPFRVVEESDSKWDCTIDDINIPNWDYVQLHEIVGGIDVGLPEPYHLLVSHDGGLALPPIEKLRGDQQLVEFFNRCLASLLIGGVICNSISLDNLQFGSVIDWKYLKSNSAAQSGSNQFHDRIRMKKAAPIEAIALYKPRTVKFDNLVDAMSTGLATLQKIPELSPEFLLKGITGSARRDWGTALSNLWIVVEQLTQHLWLRDVIEPEKSEQVRISGRRDQLADIRTWTIAARHELLFQKGIISNELLSNLNQARRARNELAHKGKHPDETVSNAAVVSIHGMFKLALEKDELPLFSICLNDHSISDPFQPIDHGPLEPEFWMEIPKLPGEHELEIEEAKVRSNEPDGSKESA